MLRCLLRPAYAAGFSQAAVQATSIPKSTQIQSVQPSPWSSQLPSQQSPGLASQAKPDHTFAGLPVVSSRYFLPRPLMSSGDSGIRFSQKTYAAQPVVETADIPDTSTMVLNAVKDIIKRNPDVMVVVCGSGAGGGNYRNPLKPDLKGIEPSDIDMTVYNRTSDLSWDSNFYLSFRKQLEQEIEQRFTAEQATLVKAYTSVFMPPHVLITSEEFFKHLLGVYPRLDNQPHLEGYWGSGSGYTITQFNKKGLVLFAKLAPYPRPQEKTTVTPDKAFLPEVVDVAERPGSLFFKKELPATEQELTPEEHNRLANLIQARTIPHFRKIQNAQTGNTTSTSVIPVPITNAAYLDLIEQANHMAVSFKAIVKASRNVYEQNPRLQKYAVRLYQEVAKLFMVLASSGTSTDGKKPHKLSGLLEQWDPEQCDWDKLLNNTATIPKRVKVPEEFTTNPHDTNGITYIQYYSIVVSANLVNQHMQNMLDVVQKAGIHTTPQINQHLQAFYHHKYIFDQRLLSNGKWDAPNPTDTLASYTDENGVNWHHWMEPLTTATLNWQQDREGLPCLIRPHNPKQYPEREDIVNAALLNDAPLANEEATLASALKHIASFWHVPESGGRRQVPGKASTEDKPVMSEVLA